MVDPPATAPPRDSRRRAWWALRAVASGALGVVLLVIVLPRVTGARWSAIADVLGRLTATELAGLTAVWLAGLWCYTFPLTATLPGLRRPQALTVNVTGSAVSNLMPFGGAVGLDASFAILRSWGFAPSRVALSAVVTGVWNVLAKMVLPLLALVGLLLAGDVATGRLAVGAAVAAAALALALALFVGTLWSERVAAAVGRGAQRLGHGLLAAVRSPRRLVWSEAVPRWRHGILDLVRGGWVPLTLGLVGFLGAQALLLGLILHALGEDLSPAEVFAGYAFGRLLSTSVVPPGGIGVAEPGVAGLRG